MREIKFRAWDKNEKLMFYWHRGLGGVGFVSEGGHYRYSASHVFHIPNDFELLEFTGLKDSKGNEIFESDIVLFTYWWFDGNHAESELKGEIAYLPDCMSFGLKGVKNKEWCKHVGGEEDTAPFAIWLFDEADFEVIGNSFENPELLEDEP